MSLPEASGYRASVTLLVKSKEQSEKKKCNHELDEDPGDHISQTTMKIPEQKLLYKWPAQITRGSLVLTTLLFLLRDSTLLSSPGVLFQLSLNCGMIFLIVLLSLCNFRILSVVIIHFFLVGSISVSLFLSTFLFLFILN